MIAGYFPVKLKCVVTIRINTAISSSDKAFVIAGYLLERVLLRIEK